MTPDEANDVRHEKRRKLLDTAREERLRAMREAEPDPVQDSKEDKEKWGDDDEEVKLYDHPLSSRIEAKS
jgi:hypothetical protein